nr:LysR family transcriptional regulator [Pseudomonas aeruginosa]
MVLDALLSERHVSRAAQRLAMSQPAVSHALGVWDGSLGVYVIRGERDLYYRQRTYYRWDGGWFWSTSPQGPWTETDARGIPPGLSRRYANP